jgi:tetratricopeptide (TPR) repeat protein
MPCSSRSLMVLMLCAVAAPGQWRGQRQQDPINAALQDCYKLRGEGNHDAAMAKREEARALLDQAPVEAPQFSNWLQQVTQLYERAGKSAEVRSIAQAALGRSSRLGDAHPSRVMLLNTLAGSWQRDGSLLKAAAYWEQAATALDAAPAGGYQSVQGPDPANVYQQLANLYRQLGRPDAAVAARARAASHLRNNPFALASFYEQQGQTDEAEAMYKQLAGQARNPSDAINALQSLANIYQREGRQDDAAAAIRSAIAAAESSANSPRLYQSFWLRQRLAGFLQQAGRNDQADQIYQQLLSDPQGDPYQAVTSFAGYLMSTQRAAQGAKLLEDYLASHSDLNPGLEANALNLLAGMTEDPQRADAYRRAAASKQPIPPAAAPNSVAETMRAAHKAANEGRLDEAFSLSLRAIGTAPLAPDRDSIPFDIQSVAGVIANKLPAKADELFRRLLAAAEEWAADAIQSLRSGTEFYIRFLLSQPGQRADIPAAIERYQNVVASAQGADAGSRAALNMTIDSQRFPNSLSKSIFPAEERLRLEESLSGTTSQPYLSALRILADLYAATGDPVRALPLRRQMVAIADLTAAPGDPQPAQVRLDAAVAFASQRQFDEADRLAGEAVSIAKALRPPWATQVTQQVAQQLDQIRQMEKAAQ